MNCNDLNDSEDLDYYVCKATESFLSKRSDVNFSANSSIEDLIANFSRGQIISTEGSCFEEEPSDVESNELKEIMVGKQPLGSVENKCCYLTLCSPKPVDPSDKLSPGKFKEESLDNISGEPVEGANRSLELLSSAHENDHQLSYDYSADTFLKSLGVTVSKQPSELKKTQWDMSPTTPKSVWYGKLNDGNKHESLLKLRFCDETPKAADHTPKTPVRRRSKRIGKGRGVVKRSPMSPFRNVAFGTPSQEFAKLRECSVKLLRFDDETQPNEVEILQSSDDDENDVIVDIITEDDTKQEPSKLNSVFKPGFTSTQQSESFSSDVNSKPYQVPSIKTATIGCQTTPIECKSIKLGHNFDMTSSKESKTQGIQTQSDLTADKALSERRDSNVLQNPQSVSSKKTLNFVFSKRPSKSVTSTPKHVKHNQNPCSSNSEEQQQSNLVQSTSAQYNQVQSGESSARALGEWGHLFGHRDEEVEQMNDEEFYQSFCLPYFMQRFDIQ